MSVRDDEARDKELAARIASEIEATCEALHTAIIRNRAEEAEDLSSALRDQASAYRELREIPDV